MFSYYNFADNVNYNITENDQLKRCRAHRDIWLKFDWIINNDYKETSVKVHKTVHDVLQEFSKDNKYDVLVTGSLHLVGATLSLLDPNLSGNQENYLRAQNM